VRVGFRGGSISQWYPQRQGGEVPPALTIGPKGEVLAGGLDFAKGYSGRVDWDVDVLAPGDYSPAAVLDGAETPAWLYPRQTASNLVQADGRAEKYLFYRGIGRFDLPVAFSMPDDATLNIENRGAERVPFLLVFHNPEGAPPSATPRFTVVPGLDSGAATSVPMRELAADAGWQMAVFESLVTALEAEGLYRDEADAMVQTWWASYFKTPGLRVFWIVPRAFTDQVLPIALDPRPESLVRVLVGRAEVLTPSFERSLRREYREAGDPEAFRSWDRFGLAYRERVEALEAAGAD
jgi:hypothetical protein